MNTIPTTFNSPSITYTVVGGRKKNRNTYVPSNLSILVLNRGNRLYKDTFFSELENFGNFDILSVETPDSPYDVEVLAAKHPRVRFLIFHSEVSFGKQINTGIAESHGNYVLVLWNDIRIPQKTSTERLITKLKNQDVLCLVPLLQNQRFETIPSVMGPAFHKRKLEVVALPPKADGMNSLYPFDFTGIYNRARFILSGGYDVTMNKSYWQKMDFGLRAHMWGERIICDTTFRMNYIEEIPSEETTPETNYKIFFLKNLCVRFQGDIGVLPYSRFLSYLIKSGGTLIEALHEFKKVKAWVETNKYRFKHDARGVTELWEILEI